MKNQSSASMRQSSIELLRILAAFGVIIQHFNNPRIGGAIRAIIPGSAKGIILGFLQVSLICAVNLYVLISGYFMRDMKKRDLLKPVKLISMLFIFEFLFYCAQELFQGKPFEWSVLLQYYIPNYWFIFIYIALYLISPYINLMWKNLSRRNRKILLILSMALFSFYPIISEFVGMLIGNNLQGTSAIALEGSQFGYTIVNFVLMYLIGCALRDRKEEPEHKDMKPAAIIVLLFLNITVLLGWMIAENTLIPKDPSTLAIAYRYQNPLVISEAVLYFMLFSQMKLKNSRILNSLAAASFPSYIIHINLFRYCKIEQVGQESVGLMLVHVFGCFAAIYLISWILYNLYVLVTRPLFALVDRKWTRKRIYSVE